MFYDYEYGEYYAGGTYIAAMEGGELYGDVSICLVEYGIELPDNQIAVPMKGEFRRYIYDLAKKIIKIVEYGPYHSEAIIISLKDDWKDLCKPIG